MRTKGFIVGAVVIVAMLVLSSAAFVQSSHPVGQPQTGTDATAENCAPGSQLMASGASGVPNSCAEVHATALAAGKLSRERFDYAQAQLTAFASHASGAGDAIEVTPAVVTETVEPAQAKKPAQCDWTKGACEPATGK
jgi:hypothetical protein